MDTLLAGVKKLQSCRFLGVKVWLHTHLCRMCFVNWTQVRVICEEGASFEKMPPSECLWASLWYIFFVDGCGKVWATVRHFHPWTGGLELKKRQSGQAMGSKPVSSVTLASVPAQLPSVKDYKLYNEANPSCIQSRCLSQQWKPKL